MTLPAPVQQRLISVEEFERMIEAGILTRDERLELVEGAIVEMTPIGPRHAARLKRLTNMVRSQLPPDLIMSIQDPIALGIRSRPQPDFALIRHRADFYETALPGPEDTLLVVEISDSSLPYDLTTKIPLYARANITEVWIIDVEAREVTVHRAPQGGVYQQVSRPGRGEILSPSAAPQIRLAVSELLM